MTTPQINTAGSNTPSNLQDQFDIDLENYEADLAGYQSWQAQLETDLEKLKAMIAAHVNPDKILNTFVPQMMAHWQDDSNASRLVLTDKMNLNTDIRNFESTALSDLNQSENMKPGAFTDMITCLQLAASDIMHNPDVFGTNGTTMVDQINDFANQFSGSPVHQNRPTSIFDIDPYDTGSNSDYTYLMANISPSSGVPSPMFNTMSQDMGNVNSSCTSVGAEVQVKLTYLGNILTNMLTMYKGVLKSDNDLLQQVNRVSAQ